MPALLYREDIDDVRRRLTTWWHGGDIGRPVLLLTAPREKPAESIPSRPKPAGWLTDYSTKDFDYRIYLAARACVNVHYLGEAVPHVAPDLAPNCLALYLGCTGVEEVDTVWCSPCIKSPETACFEYDPDNRYWQFTLRLATEMLQIGRGKFLIGFPDLIEGLDTLAAMRKSDMLLTDLVERPDWVKGCLDQITECYFRFYDRLYDMIRDEIGGSLYWVWAPGRTVKLQCDFSAMISPEMFAEFMIPVLKEMTERISYSLYHWDGPTALRHHDHLLSLPRLNVIQWTPGAGVEPPQHRRWWGYYHKTIEAGKGVYIHVPGDEETIRSLKREFREEFRRFILSLHAPSLETANKLIQLAQM